MADPGAKSSSSSNVREIPRGPFSAAQTEEEALLVARYKALRLTALQLDPAAFSSTYERESRFDHATWVSRIQNPLGRTFVALDPQPLENVDNGLDAGRSDLGPGPGSGSGLLVPSLLLHSRWVGQLTLLGPVFVCAGEIDALLLLNPSELFLSRLHSAASAASEEAPSCLDGHRALYMLVGMFVLSDARRKGNGAKLVAAALDAVRTEQACRTPSPPPTTTTTTTTTTAAAATVLVTVSSSNPAALLLYQAAGFQVLPTQRGARTVSLSMDISLGV